MNGGSNDELEGVTMARIQRVRYGWIPIHASSSKNATEENHDRATYFGVVYLAASEAICDTPVTSLAAVERCTFISEVFDIAFDLGFEQGNKSCFLGIGGIADVVMTEYPQ